MAKSANDLGGPLIFRVGSQQGYTSIALSGRINEATDFAPLMQHRGRLVLDLGEIAWINSIGVRRWMLFVRACEQAGIELTFERCSPMIVSQMSMITNFMGSRSRVKSVLVPYLCPACNYEHDDVLEVSRGVTVTPARPCPKCKAEMRLDELPEIYTEALQRESSEGRRGSVVRPASP
jgi:hypothetical protein